jgi:hypothetical protein
MTKLMILSTGKVRFADNTQHRQVLMANAHLGKGVIMLLTGPPGVGKTMTAESGKPNPSVSNAWSFANGLVCSN